MSVVNHVGLAVADLDRSRHFYEGVFGFTFKNELTVPDGATTKLFGMAAPLGLHVAYLERDGWVLELLAFDDAGTTPVRERPMNEPGLTHISISVDDMAVAAARAVELGGSLEADRGFPGMVAMIRDPDGQLIELLPMTYRDTL
jgi:catechol 2,3-dioxygenase-like lactoylglutathione lyase family enzyme